MHTEMAERSKYWVGIQVLNFYSYLHWEWCMKLYLRKHGLWEIVNGIEAVQPEDGGELRHWKAKAQKALAVIKANIQQELWKDIQNAQTPNEAWDILTQKFSYQNLGTTSYLHDHALGEKLFNLNEPPVEDVFPRYVMLVKDGKPVCRTQCLNPPPKVRGSWSIFEIKPVTKYSLSDMPLCSLRPAFENSQQRREWGAFLVFLQNNNRVAAGNCGTHDFYILPPPPSADYSLVQVRYRAKDLYDQENDQGISSSGNVVGLSRPSSVFHQGTTHCFGEEVGDSADLQGKTSLQRDLNTHARQNSLAAKLPHVDHNLTHEHVQSPISSLDAIVQGRNSSQRGLDFQVGQSPLDDKLCHTDHNAHEHREDIPCHLFREKDDYLQKNFIRVDPSYLRTLSQAHSGWIFGAIAELVDNSRDAKASRLDITVTELYSKKHGGKIPVLSVIDDGHGMSHLDIVRMLSFGHKQPEVDDPDIIGRFGVGFKTGAMRLGQDAVILTQTSCSRSVALLSQSFNEGKDNLEIPIVSYHRQGSFMEVDTSISSEASANAHLQAIRDFSPFNEYIIGEKLGLFGERGTGTQIYIWNLDKWGSGYSLKWETVNAEQSSSNPRQGAPGLFTSILSGSYLLGSSNEDICPRFTGKKPTISKDSKQDSRSEWRYHGCACPTDFGPQSKRVGEG